MQSGQRKVLRLRFGNATPARTRPPGLQLSATRSSARRRIASAQTTGTPRTGSGIDPRLRVAPRHPLSIPDHLMLGLLGRLKAIHRLISDSGTISAGRSRIPRKSRVRVFADLIVWRRRNGRTRHYFEWGLDRREAPVLRSLFTYREFADLRDRTNGRLIGEGPPDYTLLLDDKHLFAQFIEGMGHPAPSTIAIVDARKITWFHPRRTESLASLLLTEVDGFCKAVRGEKGMGVFRLQVRDGLIQLNGEVGTLDQLAARLTTPHIFQRPIVQHPQLSAVHPHSINTIRLVTVRSEGFVRPFSFPVFRAGVGGSIVDNTSSDGVFAFVDPATGRLSGPGRWRGRGVEKHPDTGFRFEGFLLPFFAETVDLAIRIHEDLPMIHSVGWDLAITADGPVVIEGNSNWGAEALIDVDPNFRQEFTRLCSTVWSGRSGSAAGKRPWVTTT
jgi:hypothetical protein